MYQVHFRKSHRIELSEPSAKNTAHQCHAGTNKIASIAGIEGLVIFAPAGGASRSPSMNPAWLIWGDLSPGGDNVADGTHAG